MADASVVVSIGADVSGMTTGMAEASRSLSVVGKQAAETGEQMTRGGAAFEEAKLTAGALTGSIEELARGFAKLAAESPAVSDALRAAIPLIALAAAGEVLNEIIDKYKEYKDALDKVRSELTEVDIKSRDYAESLDLENLKLQDQINKLENLPTHNRLAEALDEIKIKADAVGKSIAEDLAKVETLLKGGTGPWAEIFTGSANEEAVGKALAPAQRAYELAVLAKDTQGQKNALLQAEAIIQAAIADEKRKQAQYDELQKIPVGQGALGTGISGADKIALQDYAEALGTVQNSLKSLSEVQTHAGLEIKEAHDEQNADDAHYVQEQQERQRKLDELTKQAVESLKEGIADSNQARAAESKLGAEQYAAMERQGKEEAHAEVEANDQVINSIKLRISQMDAQVAATVRAAEQQRSGQGASTFGNIAAERTELAAIATEINNLKVELNEVSIAKSKIADLPYVTSEQQGELQRLVGLYDEILRKLQQLQNQQQNVWDRIAEDEKKAFSSITSDLNKNLIQWMSGSESVGRAMQKVWTSLAETVITSLLRAGEQMIANAFLQKSLLDSTKLSDAAAAARHTYTSVSAIPLIGWALAPEAAAAAFAAVLAFEKGGMIPGGKGEAVPIMGHGGEMVLPAHISNFVQTAAASAGGNGNAGSSIKVNYSPQVSAIDTRGVSDMLREHGEQFTAHLTNELRRRNAA